MKAEGKEGRTGRTGRGSDWVRGRGDWREGKEGGRGRAQIFT